jgi:hypothetical protein
VTSDGHQWTNDRPARAEPITNKLEFLNSTLFLNKIFCLLNVLRVLELLRSTWRIACAHHGHVNVCA